jgi:hypothetical protein
LSAVPRGRDLPAVALARRLRRAPRQSDPAAARERVAQLLGAPDGAALAPYLDDASPVRALIEGIADASPYLFDLIERSPAIKIVTEWSVGILAAHGVDIAAYVAWIEERGFRAWRIDNDTADLVPLEPAALIGLPHSDLLLCRGDPE